MKAYILGDRTDSVVGNIIIFANTAKEAKNKGFYEELFCDSRWIDLTVKRAKEFDNMETSSHYELTKKQWEMGWWFDFTLDVPNPDESTESEFKVWYKSEYTDEDCVVGGTKQ